jgi:hypothetical protein
MWAYPGGTDFAPAAGAYRFWTNTFSDLGRLAARDGADNTLSAGLYHWALGLLALSLLAAWWVLPTLIPRCRRLGVAIRAGGVLSVVGAFGVALTPADVLPTWHAVTIGLGAVPGLSTIVLFVVGCWRDAACPRWVALWSAAVLASAAVHFLQYARHYWLGGAWTPAAPAAQKVFVLITMGFLLAVSTRQLLRRPPAEAESSPPS